MLIWGYREIALAAQKNHAHLTIVYLPAIGDNVDTNEYNNLMLWTKIDSGSSINLSNVYGNTPIDLLRIGANDNHPNAIGHQKIVNALYPKFSKIINDQLNK